MDQKDNQGAPGAADENEKFDDMDCRPESKYPEANREAATPDYIRELLAKKKGGQDAQPDDGAQPAKPGQKA